MALITGIAVVGHTAEPAECAALVARLGPDIVLLDTGAPWAIRTARALACLKDRPRVIAIALHEDEDAVIAYAEAGVAAYVTRDETLDDLLAVVRCAARGEMRCSPVTAAILLRRVETLAAERAAAQAPPPPPPVRLTPRELEIVALVGDGLSNKQIAHQLQIELPTVKNHVHHVLEKLAVRRRSDVAAVLSARRARSAQATAAARVVDAR